jgi:hypothetical protein
MFHLSRNFDTQPWSKINKLKDREHLGSHQATAIPTGEPKNRQEIKDGKPREHSKPITGISNCRTDTPVETSVDRMRRYEKTRGCLSVSWGKPCKDKTQSLASPDW